MKIIIEHSNTKREIEGAFNICGSLTDLHNLGLQILEYLENNNFSYGWISIVPYSKQKSIVNTKPKGWDE